MTLILSNDDVDKLLAMPECIAVLEEAYAELAAGRGVSRTRSDCFTPTAREDALYSLKSMDGVIPKLGVGAVRINSDIITWPKRGNNVRREKVPAAPGNRYVGLVLLFSTENGEPLAIFPDGVMQRMRVGAANGIGVKYLARQNAKTVGILGSGWQAGAQLMAACAVRAISGIRCHSPNAENRTAFAQQMTEALGIEVVPVGAPEDAIRGADIVMCATNTVDPVFFEHWIEPGMHLSSIKRPEIEAKAVKRADRVAIHVNEEKPIHVMAKNLTVPEKANGRGWEAGDGDIDFAKLPTLPDLVTGRAEGRKSDREVTCFINNIGLGYQFAAAGALLYRKAKASGAGHDLPTDWFTEDVHP
jgi:alanine dehydrogenase